MLRDLFSLFPAYAGVILTSDAVFIRIFAFPRIRGGDPGDLEQLPQVCSFSPHTRG